MGSLEDHYANREAQRPRGPSELESYNQLVGIYREITGKMLAKVRADPPERYEWVEVSGQRFIGWQLYRDYDFTCLLYLLSDGRLVRVEEDPSRCENGFYVKVGVQAVEVSPLDRSMNRQELFDRGRISHYLLRELCQAIVSHVPANFGFGDDPNWTRWHAGSR